MERLFAVMLFIPAIFHGSFSDPHPSEPPGSQSSARGIHHTYEEFSNFQEFRNRRSSIEEETLTNDRKVHQELPSEDYFSTQYIDISQMGSQLPLEAPSVAVGRGILHKLYNRVLTSTVTTNTTVTKFFTCTTAEPSTIPTCTHKARSLREPSVPLKIVSSTLYDPDSYKDSYDNSNPLETSFKGHDFKETPKTRPTGRFLITIHHSKIHTTTYINTVTQIDYASTVSVIYRGCKPMDAVEAPVCGEPHFPPCYYGYHGHYHYYTYYCNPAVYLYQGPHGYHCANGDHCGEDPTDPAAQIGSDPVIADPPLFDPSPVIAARLDLQIENKKHSENKQPEFHKGSGISHDTRIPGRINYSAKVNSKNSSEHVIRNFDSPFTNQDNSPLLAASTRTGSALVPTDRILSSATNPDKSRASARFFP